MTDPIADLLTRIRNASMANNDELTSPYSKMREDVLKVLKSEKFVIDYKTIKSGKFPELKITLDAKRGELTLKRVSKPGQRIYMGYREMKPILRGFGFAIVSTPRGMMTHKQAKAEKLGGEIICEVW